MHSQSPALTFSPDEKAPALDLRRFSDTQSIDQHPETKEYLIKTKNTIEIWCPELKIQTFTIPFSLPYAFYFLPKKQFLAIKTNTDGSLEDYILKNLEKRSLAECEHHFTKKFSHRIAIYHSPDSFPFLISINPAHREARVFVPDEKKSEAPFNMVSSPLSILPNSRIKSIAFISKDRVVFCEHSHSRIALRTCTINKEGNLNSLEGYVIRTNQHFPCHINLFVLPQNHLLVEIRSDNNPHSYFYYYQRIENDWVQQLQFHMGAIKSLSLPWPYYTDLNNTVVHDVLNSATLYNILPAQLLRMKDHLYYSEDNNGIYRQYNIQLQQHLKQEYKKLNEKVQTLGIFPSALTPLITQYVFDPKGPMLFARRNPSVTMITNEPAELTDEALVELDSLLPLCSSPRK